MEEEMEEMKKRNRKREGNVCLHNNGRLLFEYTVHHKIYAFI